MAVLEKNLAVYLVEDDLAIRNVLMVLFESVQIKVNCYSDPIVFLQAYNSGLINNGCILLDIRLPNLSGIDVQKSLNKSNNQLPIIFITAHGDIEMAVNAMKEGAFDFITKPFSNQHIIETVQRAFLWLSSFQKLNHFRKNLSKLTPREKEVLQGIINGKKNKQISYELNISLSTVEIHRSKIMKKLTMRNLAELIKYYLIANGHDIGFNTNGATISLLDGS